MFEIHSNLQEMDEPYVLLLNKKSALFQLVQQTGKAEAAKLLHTAKMVIASNSCLTITDGRLKTYFLFRLPLLEGELHLPQNENNQHKIIAE